MQAYLIFPSGMAAALILSLAAFGAAHEAHTVPQPTTLTALEPPEDRPQVR